MTSASNFGSGPAVVAAAGISIVLGIASIWGAYRRWRWLVDPNVAGWPFYSQSFVKKFFGTNALLGFTYFLGASMVGFGLWVMWNL
jgi:hypothetical protein